MLNQTSRNGFEVATINSCQSSFNCIKTRSVTAHERWIGLVQFEEYPNQIFAGSRIKHNWNPFNSNQKINNSIYRKTTEIVGIEKEKQKNWNLLWFGESTTNSEQRIISDPKQGMNRRGDVPSYEVREDLNPNPNHPPWG